MKGVDNTLFRCLEQRFQTHLGPEAIEGIL